MGTLLRTRGFRCAGNAAMCALLVLAAACSSDDDNAAPDAAPDDASTTTTADPRPPGPEAAFSDELTGGDGVYIASATVVDLEPVDYEQHEYAASGTATSYKPAGALRQDGMWNLVADDEAPYTTRVLVRRPVDGSKFSGTVLVEWLNVSGGVDTDAEFVTTHQELLREGDAWVGVSAQSIGVEGGPVAVKVDVEGAGDQGKGLRTLDPERYGSLVHPGDGYSFDIFTQVARALRAGAGLTGLKPEQLIAAGQSQSAFAMVTYYNGVQPLTKAFDGFFVHSRGPTWLPLVAPGESADIVGALGGTVTTFRTDQDAPVMDVQTETDVVGLFGSYRVRQADSDRFRLWEVAGTAHYDQTLLQREDAYASCGAINHGALHVVAKAALHALKQWTEGGEAPAEAPRLELTQGDEPALARDGDGIARGGIRTPPVDVPVATVSGAPGPTPSIICVLLGSTVPFTESRLAELYDTPAEYERHYDDDVDATIDAKFALADDRAALLAYKDASRVPG